MLALTHGRPRGNPYPSSLLGLVGDSSRQEPYRVSWRRERIFFHLSFPWQFLGLCPHRTPGLKHELDQPSPLVEKMKAEHLPCLAGVLAGVAFPVTATDQTLPAQPTCQCTL